MSEKSSIVTPGHFSYIAARTRGEDATLRLLRKEARAAGYPPISIAPEQGSFMQILLRGAGAREVVEVGTLAGYSAIWIARALPSDGRLRTVEKDSERAAFARSMIARSDVASRVEVVEGAGLEFLRSLPDGSIDALFLDADKAGYPAYATEGLRILREGGILMADNAFAFGELLVPSPVDPETPAVRAFNDWMAERPDLQAVIVPLGDGLWVGVKGRAHARCSEQPQPQS